MSEKKTKVPRVESRRPGRPTATDLREDVRNISALIAAGFNLQEVRGHLKLTARQLKYRMHLMRKTAQDRSDVWAKFQARSDSRYRHLEAIRKDAMDDDKLDVARRAIENMARLDRQVVEVGQSLGQYETAAKEIKHEHSAPTLGMFHAIGEDEAEGEEKKDSQGRPIITMDDGDAPPRELMN